MQAPGSIELKHNDSRIGTITESGSGTNAEEKVANGILRAESINAIGGPKKSSDKTDMNRNGGEQVHFPSQRVGMAGLCISPPLMQPVYAAGITMK